jgi:hypothetical protein
MASSVDTSQQLSPDGGVMTPSFAARAKELMERAEVDHQQRLTQARQGTTLATPVGSGRTTVRTTSSGEAVADSCVILAQALLEEAKAQLDQQGSLELFVDGSDLSSSTYGRILAAANAANAAHARTQKLVGLLASAPSAPDSQSMHLSRQRISTAVVCPLAAREGEAVEKPSTGLLVKRPGRKPEGTKWQKVANLDIEIDW